MKTITCKQLGGACDLIFQADTFDYMAEQSKKHGIEIFKKNDETHLKAMNEMQELMKSLRGMQAWFENKRTEFNELPNMI